MREIEVKAKLNDKNKVMGQLAALGCQLSDPIIQKDRIFVPLGLTIPVESGVNVLRIREQGGKFIFTLKQAVTNQLDCLEKELCVDNPDQLVDIFLLLGFSEVSQVNKQRRKCNFNSLEICVDSVEGLGDFIEVEKLAEEGNAEIIQKELFQFLETFNIQKIDQVFDGYDVLAAKLKID